MNAYDSTADKEKNSPSFQPIEQSTPSIQCKGYAAKTSYPLPPAQPAPNNTGLPDNLKTGIEHLSGYSMDDVQVHYNSDRPAQLQALAYAQGTDIHIATGQEVHLPHEAWHVVQQKQGRVRPTIQAKGNANVNNEAKLEKEAVLSGAKAARNEDGRFSINNKPVAQNNISPVYQLVSIKYDGGVYYPEAHEGGTKVESDELTPDQRRQVNLNLAGEDDLIDAIRQGWRNSAQNIDPVVQALAARITDAGTKAKATRLYLASQNAAVELSTFLNAQSEWQDFLHENRISMGTILSLHRSFGFEYEFATWELIDPRAAAVVSHTEVGKSAPLSRLFNVPFILETDAQNELELVAPPLLAGEVGGGINKVFISAVHALFRTYLTAFRLANQSIRVDLLPFEGEVGHTWDWEPEAERVQVATERNKWVNKPDQIGYQLNIALTPQEIATEVGRAGGASLNSSHGKVYVKIRDRFLSHTAFTNLSGPRQTAIRPAIILLAKGISNAIAIPTLTLVAQTRSPWAREDLHSYVKDLHGIWVKDSVPNITVAAVSTDIQAMGDLRALILALRGNGDLIPRDILTRVPPYRLQGAANTAAMRDLITAHDPDERGSSRLKIAAQQEADACLTEIYNRLGQYRPVAVPNARPAFLAETFGSGEGVRKDTYANIASSRNSSMHLAELRSNDSTDAFLA